MTYLDPLLELVLGRMPAAKTDKLGRRSGPRRSFAVTIPGNPLRTFDGSWVNPHRGEYVRAALFSYDRARTDAICIWQRSERIRCALCHPHFGDFFGRGLGRRL